MEIKRYRKKNTRENLVAKSIGHLNDAKKEKYGFDVWSYDGKVK